MALISFPPKMNIRFDFCRYKISALLILILQISIKSCLELEKLVGLRGAFRKIFPSPD